MVKKNLSTDERNRVVQWILEYCVDGRPRRGTLLEAQSKFNLSRQTKSKLWGAVKKQQERGEAIYIVSLKINRKSGRKIEPDLTKLASLPLSVRGSLRRLCIELKVSKSTVHRWVKRGLIRAHTSAIKPQLTADNKFLRIRFSLESLHLDRILNTLMFTNMHNIVHIDEKWFYITKGSHRYYLAPEEEEPYRTCKSKKFIGKIMFMCAVSRPILSENGSVMFDGKIGIFPFTHEVEAKRKSKYRDAGTLETKATESVTREVMKETLIEKILPAIRGKWPEGASKNIYIQQDNAKPHIKDDDPDFRVEAMKNGFNIRLVQQPLNSPDCNVNDLGWFRAIQSLQQERVCKTVDDLVNAVVESFYMLCPQTLNKVFLSLQGCLTEILKVKGQNNYKIPHMGNDALIRAGELPQCLEVPMDLARESINYLIENGQINGIEALVQRLGLEQITGVI